MHLRLFELMLLRHSQGLTSELVFFDLMVPFKETQYLQSFLAYINQLYQFSVDINIHQFAAYGAMNIVRGICAVNDN